MSHAREPRNALPRIASEPGPLGDLMRAARGHVPSLDQGAAFTKVSVRARRNRDRYWHAPAWAFGFVAVCAAGVVALVSIKPAPPAKDAAPRSPVPVAQLPVSRPEAAPRSAPEPASPAPRVLPGGESRLDDGTRVRLARESTARVENGPKGVRVGLERGTISVDVARQTEGRSFEVHARVYRFVAIGTAFTVFTSGDRVELDVSEGRVAVFRGESRLARVGAGERWPPSASGSAPRTTEPAPEVSPGSTSLPDHDCLELARNRRAREAEACFVAQAASGGLGAELALFELSRLRSDVLRSPSGALAALEEYRRRFPSGALRAEVDVAHVHLLARLGRHSELIAETARLLQAPTGRERGAELHMLRGNAFRVGLGDFRSAEREYAEVERTGGKFATDASFHRGVCLEALGDTSGAARAYQSYLDVPGRPRAAEAQKRLKALVP